MSLAGSITTSDYIDYDKAMNVANRLLKDDKQKIYGLYIIVSVNTGLRISDVLNLTWNDLASDTLQLTEKKTAKNRTIQINDAVKQAIAKFPHREGYVFLSQKRTVLSTQQVNRRLKEIFRSESKKFNISSHSLRKSFGRRVYTNNNESEKALVYLSELFNHTSPSITRKYLGIRQQELADIYMSL